MTGSNGAGGAGGVAGAGGFSGGTGSAGVNNSHGGGGGGGAGSTANGSNGLVNGNGGAGGATGGGLGGSGGGAILFGLVLGSSGTPGAIYGGGGGSGNRGLLLASVTSSSGAKGAVTITYTVGTGATMTSASVATMCSGNSINIPLTATQPSTFTFIAADNANATGESLALQSVGSGGSLINNIINNSLINQDVIYTVTPTSTAGGCVGTPQIVNVTVRAIPVLSSTLTPSAICSGTTFTYNATTIAPNPAFAWSRPFVNGITEAAKTGGGDISETLTNTTSSPINVTYVYTITSGICIGNAENVVVTVNSSSTIGLTSGTGTNNKSICINTAITAITYTVSGGATGVIATGLPAGTSGTYNAGVYTISGTPSIDGVYNYSVATTGACSQAVATGTITAGIALTSSPGTDDQKVCRNEPITNIVYVIGGGSGAKVTGLPLGVTSAISGNVLTISGAPTLAGAWHYTVSATGPCAPDFNTGLITVGLGLVNQGTNSQNICKNIAINNIDYTIVGGDAPPPVVSGLPDGVTGAISSPGIFTISGTPSVEGYFSYTVTTSGSCLSQSSLTGNITVGAGLSSAPGTDSQTVCLNTPIININYNFAGGDVPPPTVTTLPGGISGSVSRPGVFTISGNPSVNGSFSYTVSTHGSCTSQSNLTGVINVGSGLKVLGKDTQSVCKNSPIEDIAYSFAGGAVPPPTVAGLPGGVTGSITSAGVFTISGTPTIEGRFIYTLTTKGSCSAPSTLNGSITVGLGLITAGTDNQSVCKNVPIINIDYEVVGGDFPTPVVKGLPGGVSGAISSLGVFTISGTPSVEGVFNYTVTTSGTCNTQSSLTGSIAVGLQLTSAIGTDSQKVCKQTPIVNIVYAFSGGIVPAPPSITGLPGGVTGNVSGTGVFTISGTPNVEGKFTYTLSTHGNCATQSSLSGSITVGLGLIVPGKDTQSVCKNAPIADIAYAIVGGDVPPPTVSGLPGGVTGTLSSTGVFTISGTPTTEGRFIYTVTAKGSCSNPSSLKGSITVGLGLMVPGTDSQSVCKNTPIINIDYQLVGGNVPPPVVTGLPGGVSGAISGPGIFTISGTPSVEGVFNYTVSSSGTCNTLSTLKGRIAVGLQLTSAVGTDSQKVCKGVPIINIVYAFSGGIVPAPPTIAGLPAGVNGNVSGNGIYTISGTPNVAGKYTYTLTTHGNCPAQSSISGSITVGLGVKIPGKDTQSVCKNSPIADIAYTIVGGDIPPPSVTGLPGGVTGGITSAGVFTISGTPTVEGRFIYTVTTSGSCSTQSSLNGSITVGLGLKIPGTDAQSLCKGEPIINIDYEVVGGNVPPPVVKGLPGGLSGAISGPGIFTISGTPIVEGVFNYTVTSSGSCNSQSTLIGRIAVGLQLTSAVRTDSQKVCKKTPIIPITYAFGGGIVPKPPTVSGLPGGVTGVVTNSGLFTISGTPTIEGMFTYTLTTHGSCAAQSSLSGSITVGLGLKTSGRDVQGVCKNTPILDIPYTIVGGDVLPTVSNLPTGVSGSFTSPGVFVIAGTPSVAGTFVYSVTTNGSCSNQSTLSGTITVGIGLKVPGTDDQNICKGDSITPILYTVVGGDVPPPTVSGLPSGVSGGITAPGVFTIQGTPLVEGTFTYTVTSSGSCLSKSSLTGTISINNTAIDLAPAGGSDNQKICNQTPITNIVYSISGAGAGVVVSPLPSGLNSTFATGVLTISGSPDTLAGTYIYTVTPTGLCTQGSTTFTITITKPIANLSIDKNSGPPPLLINFTNNSRDATAYDWAYADGKNNDTTFNTNHTFDNLGVYTVTLTASFNGQCPDTATATIIIYKFIVPNVFTPNGDNFNDLFIVNSTGLESLDVEIYNRWGSKMAEWHTIGGGWDGHNASSNGECPAGIYYYLVRAGDIDGGHYNEKGIINLIR